MLSKKILPLWVFSVLVTFLLGYLFSEKIINNHLHNQEKIIRKNYNFKYINPILECDPDISLNNNLSSLKNSVEEIINDEIYRKNISFASVYFRDLNNGPWFGISEREYFSPASLIKVPVLIAYLKKAETDPSILQKKILNTVDPNTGTNIQNIKPSTTIEPNKEYTVEDLLEKMIVYSDNDAYNDLSSNLNPDDLMRVYKDLDIDISKAFTNPNGNIITVRDYASFYRILFNASYLNQEMSEKALSLLSRSEYKEALVAGVPQNTSVAHKFGERKYLDSGEIQFHDCGIVYAPNKPYLLCVMTKTTNIPKANATIKKISQEVYQTIVQSEDQNQL